MHVYFEHHMQTNVKVEQRSDGTGSWVKKTLCTLKTGFQDLLFLHQGPRLWIFLRGIPIRKPCPLNFALRWGLTHYLCELSLTNTSVSSLPWSEWTLYKFLSISSSQAQIKAPNYSLSRIKEETSIVEGLFFGESLHGMSVLTWKSFSGSLRAWVPAFNTVAFLMTEN